MSFLARILQAVYLLTALWSLDAYQDVNEQEQWQVGPSPKRSPPTSTTPRNYVLVPAVPHGFKVKSRTAQALENPVLPGKHSTVPDAADDLGKVKGSLVSLCSRMSSLEESLAQIRLEMNTKFAELQGSIQVSMSQISNQNILNRVPAESLDKTGALDVIISQNNENYRFLYNQMLEISDKLSNPFLGIPEQDELF